MLPPRTLAIGDIHGCLPALESLLAVIGPRTSDTLVTLGDYVDRGIDSRGVLERLLRLGRECHLVSLLGNHDQMMLQICEGHSELYIDWLMFGGNETLRSYGSLRPERIPTSHIDFLRNCQLIYETETHFFLHGNYLADVPLDDQPEDVLLWDSLKERLPGPHFSGKTAIVGHASQKNGEVLDLGYLKCIDTRCYDTGWLTVLDVGSGQVWQANKEGHLRK